MNALDPLVTGNLLVDQAYAAIKHGIQTMALLPGTALVESKLATQLNISKTPVREALGRLAQDGLTEGTPFKGYYVTVLTVKDAESIMELRAVLEGLAARRACIFLDDETLTTLADVTRSAKEESERENWGAAADLVHTAHRTIYQGCGDSRLRGMIEVLNGQFDRIRLMLGPFPERLRHSVEEHVELLAAIQARQPDVAEEVMRRHLMAVLASVRNNFPAVMAGDHLDETEKTRRV